MATPYPRSFSHIGLSVTDLDAAVSQDVVGSLAFVGFFVEERIPLDFFASAFPNA